MPRRGFIPKREVLPDPVYGTAIVTKLINQIMYDGKRGVAQNVCYEAFEMIAQKTGKEAIEVFNAAMNNIMPSLECKARRVGGATYQVPIEIRPERRQTLAQHGRASGRRDHRCLQQRRQRREAPRGYAQAGRGEQGLCALSLVIFPGAAQSFAFWAALVTYNPPYRHR